MICAQSQAKNSRSLHRIIYDKRRYFVYHLILPNKVTTDCAGMVTTLLA